MAHQAGGQLSSCWSIYNPHSRHSWKDLKKYFSLNNGAPRENYLFVSAINETWHCRKDVMQLVFLCPGNLFLQLQMVIHASVRMIYIYYIYINFQIWFYSGLGICTRCRYVNFYFITSSRHDINPAHIQQPRGSMAFLKWVGAHTLFQFKC